MNEAPEGGASLSPAWIKREARVEVSVAGDVCTKRYFVPLHLRWRTIGRRSRAHREFDNLACMHALGLPVVEPLAWSDEWRAGINIASELRTRCLRAAPTLREVIAARDFAPRIARALGRALRRFHEAGFVCNTATPRNWLVCDRGPDPEVVLCDLPNVVQRAHSTVATTWSMVDLYALALGCSRRRETSEPWRLDVLDAYCRGDRELADALTARVTSWTSRRCSVMREIGIARAYLAGESVRGRIALKRAR